ncbi:antibiotic biosynthesis monooxygenase [Planosporangium thailandense]|uniref:Antibiotic biosynthesis monooxygenase n=1 Tax=Planosporangium thailandense TaxID=765197 RepID=A0ABX0XTA2_9ACTN|nr:antibiotic biosynthesis monooxygenase [Planosporangium thailandense]NJC69241.1 antibiotic biosynthesis monooxygenase [Planosporangium thailandense]
MSAVYRVDKFAVPEPAREEFWRHVRRIHGILRAQPGFLDDTLLEQHSGPGRFNAVTIVRWSSVDDLPGARTAVEASHRAAGFEPAAFFERAGIEADVANYVDVTH